MRGLNLSLDLGATEVWVDCGVKHLEFLGENAVPGGALDVSGGQPGGLYGELDLSTVQKITHIRIERSQLTKVTLPRNVPLPIGQMFFETNPELATLDGFDGVTLTESSINPSGQTLRILDNPLLSTCRANELKALFLAAGFDEVTMQISGNLADCP